mmetsp:Transcript_23471/g.67030  ORF Transcript_23471/g.67030 Transcript_23471/m.67030 type:complete len:215 (-) Transcript_23471:723-1367(-)
MVAPPCFATTTSKPSLCPQVGPGSPAKDTSTESSVSEEAVLSLYQYPAFFCWRSARDSSPTCSVMVQLPLPRQRPELSRKGPTRTDLRRCPGAASARGSLARPPPRRRSQRSSMAIHLIWPGVVTPGRLPPRMCSYQRRAWCAEGTAPAKSSRAQIMLPVLPLPALQCTAATCFGSALSHAPASAQNSSSACRVGGQWSMQGMCTVLSGKPLEA